MDVRSLVGNTPLVELKNCSPKPGVRLFAKLEGQNPTGSIKDRIVAFMVEEALAAGRLGAGQELVEASTGNTGIALAMLGRRLGHPVRIVVPQTVFPGIASILQVYGAQIEWVAGDLGIVRAITLAREIAERDGAFLLNQFVSPANPRCHYETTAIEILRDCPTIDAFVCGLGTAGTIMGAGRRLKEHNPDLQIVAAEPHPGNQLQGLRSMDDGFAPPILDGSLLDTKILVRAASAARAVDEVLAREGILIGPSSGAVLHAALRWAQRRDQANIVVMFADSGWKYVGTPMVVPTTSSEEDLDDVLWW